MKFLLSTGTFPAELYPIIFYKKCADCIQHSNHHNTNICKNSHPHICNTYRYQKQAEQFNPDCKTDISYTIRRHFLAIRIAFAILSGSSSISTTSAASIAASDPSAPIAIPTSTRESTGASLMPSPTKATVLFSSLVCNSFPLRKLYLPEAAGNVLP